MAFSGSVVPIPIYSDVGELEPRNVTDAYKHYSIPVGDIKCTGNMLPKDSVKEAKDRAIDWGYPSTRYQVPARSYHHWEDRDLLVSLWICNCQTFYGGPVNKDELDDFERILEEECPAPEGYSQSGWVWSGQWNKGYNLNLVSWRKEHYTEVCPPHCLHTGTVEGE